MATALPPTLEGYLVFIRTVMGIPVEILPDTAPIIPMSYNMALGMVNPAFMGLDGGPWGYSYLIAVMNPPQVFLDARGPQGGNPNPPAPLVTDVDYPSYYAWMVYNLAGHFLIMFAQDTPPSTYFQDLRDKYGMNSFTPGVIQASHDQGTGQAFIVPDFVKNMTLADLGYLKTPWGRFYMGLAQAYGPTIWGLTP